MDSKLWEALDLVRERQMLKGLRGEMGGNHCALGFLDEVYDGQLVECVREALPDVKILARTAAEAFPGREDPRMDPFNFGKKGNPFNELAAFNNHIDTTKADLELVFEKAAIKSDEVL